MSASPLAELLVALARVFRSLDMRWHLFGAQAAIVHGAARLSADVDVTVDLGRRSPAVLVDALRVTGFEPRGSDIEEFVARTRILPVVHTASGIPVHVVLAGRAKDLDDAASVLRARCGRFDAERARATLGVLERALDRHDLTGAFERLLAVTSRPAS